MTATLLDGATSKALLTGVGPVRFPQNRYNRRSGRTMSEQAGDVTKLLRQLRAGDRESSERLIAAVHGELRQVAARAMRSERAGHTLQPTALVNEAFLRLAGQTGVEWQDRAHFFGVAARVMREILVDYARKHSAAKRGGGQRITL